VLRQNAIILDEPVPELDGRRVEVELREETAPMASEPSQTDLSIAWLAWAAGDDHGPIAGEPEDWPSA